MTSVQERVALPAVSFDQFHRYDELTELLNTWAAAKPELMRVESVGTSYEGRDIWLVTLTNFETGPDTEKPAVMIEANIHATEVTGCTAALNVIHRFLEGYGTDAKMTRALDTRTLYVVPRLNPDGAELALADTPKLLRSSVRPYPWVDPEDGLHQEDIDGDGRLLMMRLEDPNGAWKAHAEDARLLTRREPDESAEDGTFYRLLWEGTIQNYDGVTIKVAPPLEGLDLNRNFPMEWAPEGEQHGAGPYPTSEPEIRALVEAVVDRRNITAYIAYHTFSGVHLRPYAGYPDDHYPTPDLRTYKLIGEKATELTGYPSISIFHDFRYDPKTTIKGGAHDWAYDYLGIYAWTTEFWSPQQRAGITDYHMIEWIRDHPPEDDLKLIRWSDENLDGEAYVDWYEFDHPQLGKVELGGWDFFHFWSNAPFKFLQEEVDSHADFALFHMLVTPKLEVQALDVEEVGSATYVIRLVLQNTGWLPSYVAQKALDRKAVRPLEVELTLPDGAKLLSGKPKEDAGQLEGRALKRSILWWWSDDATSDRTKLEWVVEAPNGGTLEIEARHERAGTLRREVELGGQTP